MSGKRKRSTDVAEDVHLAAAAPVEKASRSLWMLESQDGGSDPDWVPIQFEANSILNSRYAVLDVLGKGTFGVVLKCVDLKAKVGDNAMVAIKVSAGCSRKEFMNLKLAHGKRHPRGAEAFIVEPLNTFDLCATSRPQQKYVATVMVLNECDLSTYIANNAGMIGLKDVCLLGRQLLTALACVHSCSLVHADVKPQNVMTMVRDAKRVFLLGDFGSSFRVSSPLDADYMVTRQYRAPEVVLRLGVGFPVDIWAAACVIVEFALGSPLFVSCDSVELVTRWCEVLGPPSPEVIQACPINDRFFIWRPELDIWIHPPLGSMWTRHRSRKKRQDYFYSRQPMNGETAPVSQFARPTPDPSDLPLMRMELAHHAPGWGVRLSQNVAPGVPLYTNTALGTVQWHVPKFRELRGLFEVRYPGIAKSTQGSQLLDILEKMLAWMPSERPSARDALRHPAFANA